MCNELDKTMFRPAVLGPSSVASDTFVTTYPHQFMISTSDAVRLPGWPRTSLEGVQIDTAPDLSLTMLTAADGRRVGAVFGLAIGPDGRMLTDDYRLNGSEDDAILREAEALVERTAGRFAAVISVGAHRRLYLDPVGDLAAVYNPQTRVAGSTTLFVMEGVFQDNPLFPFGEIKKSEAHYGLGHTRDRGTHRLLANHYLDLDSFQPVRHWPRADTDLVTRTGADEISAIMDEITARLGRNMSETLRERTCIVPLSGGRDSRCLVAAALPEMTRAFTLFAWRFHRMSGRDAVLGAQLAAFLGLPFQEFKFVKLTREVKALYLRRNGYSNFGTALQSLAISETLPGGMVMPRGNIMGIMRATNWNGKTEEMPFDPQHALRRLQLGTATADPDRKEQLLAQVNTWYDGLPQSARPKVYDILWLDMVLTHGQGTRNYGTPNNFVVNPFNDRRLIQLSMQLPLRLRKSDAPYDMILDRTVPALKEFAYN